METTVEKAAKNVDITEKDLLTLVALKEPAYVGLEAQLSRFRAACSDYYFLDIQTAVQKNVEVRLWGAHGKVNQRFRPFLARFREGEGKKKHVERRKAEKLYLDFIKSSMRFYRGFIQRLASHFRNIPEVFEIARKFSLDTLSADAPVTADSELKRLILRSCHATLIQLGDLSRYRETELNHKERNWGPAKGYYDLAASLDPTSGQAFNQLAVIALADNDHLRAVYYLYRAITVENPPQPARNNLGLEFRKLRTRHTSLPSSKRGDDATELNDLEDRFVVFHAYAYGNTPLMNSDEYRSDLLRQLADNLCERPFNTTIRKICFINIAAESSAKERASALVDDAKEALAQVALYQRMQSLNIATFCMLLRLLLDELQPILDENEVEIPHGAGIAARVTPVTRRILPHLRLYSAWLLSNVGFMLKSQKTTSIGVDLCNLWQVYTDGLSILVATFPLRELPELPYLLDEDEDTLAFTPFSEIRRKLHLHANNGAPKPTYGNMNFSTVRDSDSEMLFRIKELVKDGVYLFKHRNDFGPQSVPILFGQGRFVFVDDGTIQDDQSTALSRTHHGHTSSVSSVSRADVDAARKSQAQQNAVGEKVGHDNQSDTGISVSVPSTIENMVDNLVESETADAIMQDDPPRPMVKTPTLSHLSPNRLSVPGTGSWTAQDLVRQMQQHTPRGSFSTPVMQQQHNRPALPSIWQNAFTPRPGETPGSSPRPDTARHLMPGSIDYTQYESSASFEQDLLQRQKAIQARSSPLPLFCEPSSVLSPLSNVNMTNTYSGRAHNMDKLNSSPSWQGTFTRTTPPNQPSSAAGAGAGATTTTSRDSPGSKFGVIGEPRRDSAKSPAANTKGA